MKRIFFLCIAVGIVVGSAGGAATAAESVLVVFPSDKAISHAPFFVADKMGYFEQEGVKFEFTTIPGGLEPLKAVATGKAQMAFPAPSSLIVAREPNLPVRSVFAMRQKWIFGFAAMKKSNIKSIGDLKGKTIGIISESAGFIGKIMILGSKDVTLDKVNFQVVGANMAGPLAAGKVDAVYCWDTLFEQYKRQGMDVTWISGPEYDDYQSNVLASSDQMIKDKPKTIQAFLRGLVKGIVFSIEAPQATLKIIGKGDPQLVKDMDKAMVELKMANDGFQSKLQTQNGFGFHSAKSWELQAKALKDLKEVTRVLANDQYFTNEFIAGSNKIDANAIKAEARKQ